MRRIQLLILIISSVVLSYPVMASQQITDMSINSLPGNAVEIMLQVDGLEQMPSSFTIDNPARIVWDFPNTVNGLGQKQHPIGIGVARNLAVIEANERTRVVLNLVKMVPFESKIEGSTFIVKLGEQASEPKQTNLARESVNFTPTTPEVQNAIKNVDFRRGEQNEGRLIVELTTDSLPVDISQEGKTVIARFINAELPKHLIKRLDVLDFGTPVKTVEIMPENDDTRMVLNTSGDIEYVAYQINEQFIIDIKPLSREQKIALQEEEKTYTGEPLSLNFQDIEVRAVLQLIADFTGLNVITTDTVNGNITLRLQNVPWDQALDIILKTKGLAKREEGDVILIAPAEELAAREQVELQANLQVEQLAPLRTELIQVNYAKAQEMADFIKTEGSSLLTERGNISVDARTNTLLIQETTARIEEIRKLITNLDRPVRQVLIEARIVVANSDFSNELGVRFGLTSNGDDHNTAGRLEGSDLLEDGFAPNQVPLNNRLNVNLPIDKPEAGSIGFSISKLPGNTLLDLELSALESEGNGEIISSPRLITSNQREALIESGEEIPFRTTSTVNGVTEITILFKKVVLSLKVTPQITPDDRIILALEVNQDTRGEETAVGPAIDTQKIETEVLVDNGETIVLGGVYRRTKNTNVEGIPVLAKIPYIGGLFRRTIDIDNKQELLIFVTPKIIKEGLSV